MLDIDHQQASRLAGEAAGPFSFVAHGYRWIYEPVFKRGKLVEWRSSRPHKSIGKYPTFSTWSKPTCQ